MWEDCKIYTVKKKLAQFLNWELAEKEGGEFFPQQVAEGRPHLPPHLEDLHVNHLVWKRWSPYEDRHRVGCKISSASACVWGPEAASSTHQGALPSSGILVPLGSASHANSILQALQDRHCYLRTQPVAELLQVQTWGSFRLDSAGVFMPTDRPGKGLWTCSKMMS